MEIENQIRKNCKKNLMFQLLIYQPTKLIFKPLHWSRFSWSKYFSFNHLKMMHIEEVTRNYFLPTVEIKEYNVKILKIDGKDFFN